MSIGVICCRVLEDEIRVVVGNDPRISFFEVLEWGLHMNPDRLLEELCLGIRRIQKNVNAVVLGYGNCMTLDKLPGDFEVPVFYPEGDDCIGVLLGRERYREELMKEAGTWFLHLDGSGWEWILSFPSFRFEGLRKRVWTRCRWQKECCGTTREPCPSVPSETARHSA